jgi:hypothetical protein
MVILELLTHPQAGARLAEELQAAESGAADLHSRLDAARREAEKNREAVRSAVGAHIWKPSRMRCLPFWPDRLP